MPGFIERGPELHATVARSLGPHFQVVEEHFGTGRSLDLDPLDREGIIDNAVCLAIRVELGFGLTETWHGYLDVAPFAGRHGDRPHRPEIRTFPLVDLDAGIPESQSDLDLGRRLEPDTDLDRALGKLETKRNVQRPTLRIGRLSPRTGMMLNQPGDQAHVPAVPGLWG